MEMLCESYSLAGDLTAIAICLICWIALNSTYAAKQNNLVLFYWANGLIFLAATGSMTYHILLDNIRPEYVPAIYMAQILANVAMMITYFIFCVYLTNLFEVNKKGKNIVYMLTVPALIAFVLFKFCDPYFKLCFYLDNELKVNYNYRYDMFLYLYVYFGLISLAITIIYRNRLITKMRRCLQIIMCISFVVIFIEGLLQSTTLACVSFTFPVLGALFLFNYNAYDTKTGTLDIKSFNNYITDTDNHPMSMFYLYLKDYSLNNNKDISDKFLYYTGKIFGKYCMFRITDNVLVLAYKKPKKVKKSVLMKNVLQQFERLYMKFHISYKLIHVEQHEELHTGDDYLSFCDFVSEKLSLNTFHECEQSDIDAFVRMKTIKEAIFDICEHGDLDDVVVKVYCQPILNTTSNTYKNAEALMRIQINETMYYPDEFIPIAEKHGCIHTLSKIMLNKVCKHISTLMQEQYEFNRISINVSTTEFMQDNFCKDILHIIKKNRIPANKIAIEITESNDDAQYDKMKEAITTLSEKGIRFYLDDFGTGYSNFQRIFALPIDVIKFDRSVTAMSKDNESLFNAIKGLAKILSDAGSKILFEGVEDTEDEERCRSMYASYLQGYEYSKPIKIEYLKDYFKKMV